MAPAAAIDAVNFEFRLAGNADLAANQPGDLRVQCHRAGLGRARYIEIERKKNFVLITEVHERPEWQPLRRGKLQWAGCDSIRQRPLNVRRLAGVARILPIDMPSGIELEVEARLVNSRPH